MIYEVIIRLCLCCSRRICNGDNSKLDLEIDEGLRTLF